MSKRVGVAGNSVVGGNNENAAISKKKQVASSSSTSSTTSSRNVHVKRRHANTAAAAPARVINSGKNDDVIEALNTLTPTPAVNNGAAGGDATMTIKAAAKQQGGSEVAANSVRSHAHANAHTNTHAHTQQSAPQQQRCSYKSEWERLFHPANSSARLLLSEATSGRLRNCRFRSVCWRVCLGILPLHAPHTWPRILAEHRARYATLRAQSLRDPRSGAAGEGETPPTNTATTTNAEEGGATEEDHPLSAARDSVWNAHFQRKAAIQLILQDVLRTFPELQFFHGNEVRNLMVSVLYCHCHGNRDAHTQPHTQPHTQLGYRQGMHEILAPLVFVLHSDQLACDHMTEQQRRRTQTAVSHHSSLQKNDEMEDDKKNEEKMYEEEIEEDGDELDAVIRACLDSKYLEHDAFLMFETLMRVALTDWYSAGPSAPVTSSTSPTSSSTTGMRGRSANGVATNGEVASPAPQPRPLSPLSLSGMGGGGSLATANGPPGGATAGPANDATAESPLIARLLRIHAHLLKQHDLDVFSKLAALQIQPQMFGVRWLRLLFGREFTLQDLLVTWDCVFAVQLVETHTHTHTHTQAAALSLVDHIYVAMLVQVREPLLHAAADFTEVLKLLMRFSTLGVDVGQLLAAALHFWDELAYPRPRNSVTVLSPHSTTRGINLHRHSSNSSTSSANSSNQHGSSHSPSSPSSMSHPSGSASSSSSSANTTATLPRSAAHHLSASAFNSSSASSSSSASTTPSSKSQSTQARRASSRNKTILGIENLFSQGSSRFHSLLGNSSSSSSSSSSSNNTNNYNSNSNNNQNYNHHHHYHVVDPEKTPRTSQTNLAQSGNSPANRHDSFKAHSSNTLIKKSMSNYEFSSSKQHNGGSGSASRLRNLRKIPDSAQQHNDSGAIASSDAGNASAIAISTASNRINRALELLDAISGDEKLQPLLKQQLKSLLVESLHILHGAPSLRLANQHAGTRKSSGGGDSSGSSTSTIVVSSTSSVNHHSSGGGDGGAISSNFRGNSFAVVNAWQPLSRSISVINLGSGGAHSSAYSLANNADDGGDYGDDDVTVGHSAMPPFKPHGNIITATSSTIDINSSGGGGGDGGLNLESKTLGRHKSTAERLAIGNDVTMRPRNAPVGGGGGATNSRMRTVSNNLVGNANTTARDVRDTQNKDIAKNSTAAAFGPGRYVEMVEFSRSIPEHIDAV